MAFFSFLRGGKQPPNVPPSSPVPPPTATPPSVEEAVAEAVAPEPAAAPAAPTTLLSGLWSRVQAAFATVDNAFCWLAIPFGATITDPYRRYGVMLGVFAAVYVVGALPVPYVPLVALAFGYLGVLAVGRAWVRNENERARIVKKLSDADPDAMPDLRWTALVSALQLLILFPLAFMQLHRQFGLYRVEGPHNFLDWLWFSLDKTYLKALPDWSMLYGVHISSIDFDSAWGRHLVLLSRLTFDYLLIQAVIRLIAIRGVVREAVSAVKADPELAVRLGRRAIEPLLEKLRDPDRAVRGAAANALTQLGDADALLRLAEEVRG